MDDFRWEEILLLFRNHQQTLQRVLRSSNEQVQRRIRRSRHNLETAQTASFAMFPHMHFAYAEAVNNVIPRFRSIGRKGRSAEWWLRDVLQTYDDEQWLEDFRKNRATFFQLVDLVAEDELLRIAENTFIQPLSVQNEVAIAVYKLASCGEYRTVGRGFGDHKSTVFVVLHAFCKDLIRRQMHRLLSRPNREQCEVIAQAFEGKYNLPQVLGAIDGSHIPVTAPRDGAADFTNRKCYASIIMQVVVDHRMLLRDVTAQHPGCNHDSSLFRDSYLYQNHKTMIPQTHRELLGHNDGYGNPIPFDQPYYLIGDPAYPLSTWIMKTYSNEVTVEQTSFNLYLNSLRIIVEHAFGRLKGRWRILCKISDLDVYNMSHIILTCALLHNFVEMARQPYNANWDQARMAEEALLHQPDQPQVPSP